MKTQRNNLSSIPFRMSGNPAMEPDFPKEWYAYGKGDSLIVKKGEFPAFVFLAPFNGVCVVTIHKTNGEVINVGTLETDSEHIQVVRSGGEMGSLVTAQISNALISTITTPFRIVISNDEETWLSPVICQHTHVAMIRWWNDSNIDLSDGSAIARGPVMGGSFKHYVCINTEVAKPGYEYEEEAERRDGRTYPVKQLIYKRYKFIFLANEDMLDVLRLARMADHIEIETPDGVYEAQALSFNSTWLEQGYLASVNAEFITDSITKKIGKSYNL